MTTEDKIKILLGCVLSKPAEGLGAVTITLLSIFWQDLGMMTMVGEDYRIVMRDCMNQKSQSDSLHNTDVNQGTLVGSLDETDVG